MPKGAYVVVDIGKTLSKITLWSSEGQILDRQTRPNELRIVDGVRRLDADGIGGWLPEALKAYAGHPIKTIIPVAHGAAFVALNENGPLFPPLDYEQPIPAAQMGAYRDERDSFSRSEEHTSELQSH